MLTGAMRRWGCVLSTFALPTIIVNVGNAIAYLFQFFLVHTLTLDDFGKFNAVFSALNVVWTPSVIIPLIVSGIAASDRSFGLPAERRLLRKALTYVGLGGLLCFALAAATRGYLMEAFDVSAGTLFAAFLGTVLLFAQSVFAGLLQARREYIAFSFGQAAIPTLRLVFGVVLVWGAGLGVGGAVWSCALPIAVAIAIGLWTVRDILTAQEVSLPKDTASRAIRLALPLTLSAMCVTLLSNIDLVIVRINWPGDAAGYYSAAAILSRMVLLVPSALIAIIFSESALSRDDGRRGFMTAMGMVAAMAGGMALLFIVGAEQWLRLLMGAAFSASSDLLRLTSAAMAALVMAQAAMMYSAGRKDFRYLIPAGLVCLAFIAAAGTLAESPAEVAWMLLSSNLLLAAIVFGLTFIPRADFRRQTRSRILSRFVG